MNIKTGIGVTTLCAMLAAVPVFGYANASEIDVSGTESVAEESTEQKEEYAMITEDEASEALDETSTAVTDPDGDYEYSELPASEETENEEYAVILPAEGQVDAEVEIAPEEGQAESAEYGEEHSYTLSLEDVEVIPANGVNGSFVSKYQDTIPVEWSEEFGAELYSPYSVCYEDENLSKLAEEYLAKGYAISDLKQEGELLGTGVGYGDYYFNCGFCVVDDISGNNSFITYVAKISQNDFDKFIEDLGDNWTKISDTKYSFNDGLNDCTITFDPATGILIYTNILPTESEG